MIHVILAPAQLFSRRSYMSWVNFVRENLPDEMDAENEPDLTVSARPFGSTETEDRIQVGDDDSTSEEEVDSILHGLYEEWSASQEDAEEETDEDPEWESGSEEYAFDEDDCEDSATL